VNVSEGITVTPTPPGVLVNILGVLVAMTVEAVRVVNVAVEGRAKVGVAALEDAQALIKTRPISRIGRIILIFIFTSIDNYISCHIIRLINKGWNDDE